MLDSDVNSGDGGAQQSQIVLSSISSISQLNRKGVNKFKNQDRHSKFFSMETLFLLSGTPRAPHDSLIIST